MPLRKGTFSPPALPGPDASQHLPNQGLPQGFLPRRARPGLERLALAGPEPAADPGPTGAGAGAFGRGADGPVGGRLDAPGEHHPLLHEPDLPRRPEPAAAADRHPHHGRVRPRPGRGGRPAGRGGRQPGAGPGPPLPGPGPAAGDRLLFELLPLLHAVADGGPRLGGPQRGAAGGGVRVHPPHPRRSATCSSPAAIRWP